jgi:hypothetical protein
MINISPSHVDWFLHKVDRVLCETHVLTWAPDHRPLPLMKRTKPRLKKPRIVVVDLVMDVDESEEETEEEYEEDVFDFDHDFLYI